ncbi:MAG: cell division protein FtsQ/DivIB [Acidobacteriota bacterium]
MGVRRRAGTVSPRFLRRRQHEQVRRSRRGRTWRRRLFLLGALFGIGFAGGGVYAARYYLTHAPRFRLEGVDLSETRHAPREAMRRELERHRGTNLFRLDLARLERELSSFPWVRRTFVKRVLPNRLYCTIEERTPRGLALIGGRVMLVDGDGETIAAYDAGTREYSAPILAGVGDRDPERSRGRIRRGLELLNFLRARHPDLLREISEVDLARADRITLVMNDGGPPVRLHPGDFGANLERFLAMREYLATHFGDGAYVDLRFRDRIVFRPSPSGGR